MRGLNGDLAGLQRAEGGGKRSQYTPDIAVLLAMVQKESNVVGHIAAAGGRSTHIRWGTQMLSSAMAKVGWEGRVGTCRAG
jgi:hypothetical protein